MSTELSRLMVVVMLMSFVSDAHLGRVGWLLGRLGLPELPETGQDI
jgi:hypothetical protein